MNSFKRLMETILLETYLRSPTKEEITKLRSDIRAIKPKVRVKKLPHKLVSIDLQPAYNDPFNASEASKIADLLDRDMWVDVNTGELKSKHIRQVLSKNKDFEFVIIAGLTKKE